MMDTMTYEEMRAMFDDLAVAGIGTPVVCASCTVGNDGIGDVWRVWVREHDSSNVDQWDRAVTDRGASARFRQAMVGADAPHPLSRRPSTLT